MPQYETVLLDADMTLFDFRRSEREALRDTLRSFNLPWDEQVLRDYAKINSALWDAFARGEIDQDFLSIERFAALMRAHGGHADPWKVNHSYELALGETAYLLPGAEDFCRALSGMGLTLAIATNGLPAAQRGRYVRTGLDRYIPHLFISMELGAQKPLPAFFDRICEALNIRDRSQAVMVGDGLGTDILGGNRAGLDTIWYNPDRLPLTGPARPTYTAGSYGEVLDLLSRPSAQARPASPEKQPDL